MQTEIPRAARHDRSLALRQDSVAGLTTAAVVVPKCLAYASLIGLPLQAGLYVACFPLLVYALLGSSSVLSVSSTTTIAILTAGQLAASVPEADPERLLAAASMLALLTGAFLLLAGALKLGFLADFISDPVLTGFKAGIGIVIVVDQAPKLFGLHVAKGSFAHFVAGFVEALPETSLPTLALSAGVVALLVGVGRLAPRAPAPLFAVVLGAAAVALLGLEEHGVALSAQVGAGFSAPALPDLSLAGTVWPGALGIALMSFTESIAAGRAFAPNGSPGPAPNRELLALGAANAAGALFHAFPAGGGTSQTAVNARSGAQTKTAGLVTAGIAVAITLFFAPMIHTLPQAALAAVVVVTSLPLIAPAEFRAILRVRRTEFLWALAACAGVVLVGTLEGILIAVAISVLTLMYQANHPLVYAVGRAPGTEDYRPMPEGRVSEGLPPGVLVLRTEGRMTFANASRVSEKMRALIGAAKPRVVIFECSAIPDFEYTALKTLTSAEEKLAEAGVSLWLATLNPAAARAIQRAPLAERLGRGRIFGSLREAVHAYESRMETTK